MFRRAADKVLAVADAGSQSPIETDDFRSRAKLISAYANDLEKEILVEEQANLGEKGRYDPSVGAQWFTASSDFTIPITVFKTCFRRRVGLRADRRWITSQT